MTSHCRELGRRLQRQQFRYLWPIERQVPARTDPDFEHAAFGRADHPLAIRPKLLVPHREIANLRQDDVVVEAHGPFPPAGILSLSDGTTDGWCSRISTSRQRSLRRALFISFNRRRRALVFLRVLRNRHGGPALFGM